MRRREEKEVWLSSFVLVVITDISYYLGSLSSASCGEATPPEEGVTAPSPTPLDCGSGLGEEAWRGSSLVNLRDYKMFKRAKFCYLNTYLFLLLAFKESYLFLDIILLQGTQISTCGGILQLCYRLFDYLFLRFY